jgi:hypothetical protein
VTPLVLAVLLQAAAAQEPAPLTATLADVAFMAGHWVDASPEHLSEEVWTEPSGDSMLGMWRYVARGQAKVLELLTLKAEGGFVVLRLRHFDGRMVGREDKDTPVELRLVAREANSASFEGPEVGGAGRVRLSYRRTGPDTLLSVLDKGGKPQEFSFRRAPARP